MSLDSWSAGTRWVGGGNNSQQNFWSTHQVQNNEKDVVLVPIWRHMAYV